MTPKSDWRHLAEQASVEMDANRLTALVEELMEALDEEEAARHQKRSFICSSVLPATEEPAVA